MNKMLFRKVKERKIQSIGIVLLTFLWMFVVAFSLNLYITNLDFQGKYYAATNVEDFNFIPSNINSVDNMADKYSFNYEEEYCKEFEENGISYRIVSLTRDIDTPYVIEGKVTNNTDDVLVNIEFANENNIVPGDNLVLQGNTYHVSGIITLVNYIKMHVRDDGFFYEPKKEALIVANKDSLFAMEKGEINVRYLAKFSKNITEEEKTNLSSKIVRSDQFMAVTMQNDNSSIAIWDGKISVYFLLTIISLCVLSVIIVLLLILFIFLMVNEDIKNIGILLANGMTKKRIWFSYFGMIVSLLLPFGIIGFLAGALSSPYFNAILGQDLSLPKLTFHIPFPLMGIFAGIIIWLAVLVTLLGVSGILCKNMMELIKNNKVKTVSRFEKVLKKMIRPRSVEGKMKLSFAIRSKLLLVLVLFSVFASGVEFLLSYSIYRMNDKMQEVQSESMNFEYQVYFSEKKTTAKDGNQYFTKINGVAQNGGTDNVVQIYAIDKGELLQLGVSEIEKESVILNQTSATVLKARVGDVISLAIYDKVLKLKVQAICDRVVGKEVFVDYQGLLDQGVIEEGFDGMYTNQKDIDKEGEQVASVLSKKQLLKNYEESQDVIKAGSVILAVLGIIIPVILIAITVSVLISQNQKEIAILRANGITERGMNKMIYKAYNVFLILGIGISIPYSFMILQIIFSIAVKASGIKYPVEIDIFGIAISIIMTLVIYFGTMFVLRLKNKVSVERITYDFG